ncbi:MAG: sialic acid synthase SpsE, partial [Bacillariaceae sp.]|jgi:sialic acid synthase SpsE
VERKGKERKGKERKRNETKEKKKKKKKKKTVIMTRGLNPPDTLSVENVQTLRSVRRDIYYHGMIGGGTYLLKICL